LSHIAQSMAPLIAVPIVAFFPTKWAASKYAMNGDPAFVVEIKKDGLTGDELKFATDFEKRLNVRGKGLSKDEIMNEVRSMMNPFKDVDGAKLKAALEAIGEGDTGLRAIVKQMGGDIEKLLKGETGGEQVKDTRAQIMEWRSKNAASLTEIKNGSKAGLSALEIRAANSPMTPANTLTNSINVKPGIVPQFEAGFRDLRRVKPTFWDYIPKGRTSSESYSWVNKKVDGDQGSAAFIGPGVYKPGVSFTFEREVSNAKKIAVSGKITTELLEDVDGMESHMKGEMAYKLKNELNLQYMTGVASATNPAGIQTLSVPFSAAGLSVKDPNNFDVIRSVVAQLAIGHFGGLPVTVFINPIDSANMDMTKTSALGTYVIPPFSTVDGKNVGGAVVIEDNNVEVGYFQAACLDLFTTLIYKDFTVKLGFENDDFTKNLVTYVAEMRVHSFVSDNDAGFAIYDTFDNVKALIEEDVV
jgi:hypothetical protein